MFELKQEIIKLIKSGKEITLKWDCGGDEALVYTSIDGRKLDFEEGLERKMDIYIVNFLSLPSAGEFRMEGEGRLILENDEVYLEYESLSKGYMDEGEFGEKEPTWVEENRREEEYSGRKKMFAN